MKYATLKTPTTNISDGVLRRILETACEEQEASLNALTVLSAQVDPYRLDTAAGHRDGAWAAEQLLRAFGTERRTHWRGLHYAIVAAGNIRKPDDSIYRNTDDDWIWLSSVAGKAARWLNYIPFDRITDNRNGEPTIRGASLANGAALFFQRSKQEQMKTRQERLRSNARKLDKLNIHVVTVLAAMKRGEALLMEYCWYGRAWILSRSGYRVPDDVAQVVIKSTNVANVGDALDLAGAQPQTWRWIGA